MRDPEDAVQNLPPSPSLFGEGFGLGVKQVFLQSSPNRPYVPFVIFVSLW